MSIVPDTEETQIPSAQNMESNETSIVPESHLDERLAAFQRKKNPLYQDPDASSKALALFDQDNGDLSQNHLFYIWKSWANAVGYINDEYCQFLKNNYCNNNIIKSYAQRTFSYAIPTKLALSVILEYGTNILEVGSGTGYWLNLLKDMGAKSVIGIDNQSWQIDPIYHPNTVVDDAELYIINHYEELQQQNTVLLIVWAHWDNRLFHLIPKTFPGKYMVVVEESGEGCTWSMDRYHAVVEAIKEKSKTDETVLLSDHAESSDHEDSNSDHESIQDPDPDDNKEDEEDEIHRLPKRDLIEKMMNLLESVTDKIPVQMTSTVTSHDQYIENGKIYGDEWKLIRTVIIPTWKFIHDRLNIYERVNQ